MHIQSKEFYANLFDYNPETGALFLKGTEETAVQYRRSNRAVVLVWLDALNNYEEQPAAIIAWILAGHIWAYGTMIISKNRDLGDITLSNLESMAKSAYEKQRANSKLLPGFSDIKTLCTLALAGTLDTASALRSILVIVESKPSK